MQGKDLKNLSNSKKNSEKICDSHRKAQSHIAPKQTESSMEHSPAIQLLAHLNGISHVCWNNDNVMQILKRKKMKTLIWTMDIHTHMLVFTIDLQCLCSAQSCLYHFCKRHTSPIAIWQKWHTKKKMKWIKKVDNIYTTQFFFYSKLNRKREKHFCSFVKSTPSVHIWLKQFICVQLNNRIIINSWPPSGIYRSQCIELWIFRLGNRKLNLNGVYRVNHRQKQLRESI